LGQGALTYEMLTPFGLNKAKLESAISELKDLVIQTFYNDLAHQVNLGLIGAEVAKHQNIYAPFQNSSI